MSNKKIETGRLPYTKVSLILDFLRGSIRYFAISIFSALCVTGLDMLSPQLIRTTVDCVLDDNELRLPEFLMNRIDRIGGVGYLREHLWLIGGLILLVALLSVAFRYLFMLFNAKGAEGLVETMRNRLFSHIQRLPFSWHMQNQTGDIIQRCTSDVDMVKNFVSEQLTSVFRIIILIALSLVFMFSMNPRLTLVALASIPVIIAYSAYFHSKIGSQFMKCDENEGILSTIAQENLTGVRVVRAFGREKYETDRFEKQNNIYTDLWIRLCRFMALFWGAGDLISGLQVMLIVILGSVFCVRGGMTAGEFIAFISYNAMLTWPVRSLGRMIAEMSKAGVSIERIRYIMNSAPERDIPGADRPEADIPDNGMPDMHGDIEFQNVSFSYADTPVLSGISFKIPQGTTFGILGGTGSGKSTLMYLLNRLYELAPESGRITIGGVDIANMKGSWVRSHIGMVLQESFLFSRTIAENIGITRKDMSLSDIRWAASIACVDGAICEFTNGYDTVVGERGVTLSGGQKQRIAIARMLTQKTPIMVFDDSLSAVDSETDAKIRQALKKNLGDSTVILISHRVTTLMQAENILVLDKGRIAELGSHEELMKKNGIYRRIYDMQMTLPEEVAAHGA